jgi:hypothetical protein
MRAYCPFAAYLMWSKLTSNEVVCPVAGCSTILSSPYAQIGPFPLPALGMAAYGSVAALSLIASLQEKQSRITKRLDSLATSQRAILAGAPSGCRLPCICREVSIEWRCKHTQWLPRVDNNVIAGWQRPDRRLEVRGYSSRDQMPMPQDGTDEQASQSACMQFTHCPIAVDAHIWRMNT